MITYCQCTGQYNDPPSDDNTVRFYRTNVGELQQSTDCVSACLQPLDGPLWLRKWPTLHGELRAPLETPDTAQQRRAHVVKSISGCLLFVYPHAPE